MALDPCLVKLMAQTINVAPLAAVDAFGDSTFGAATAVKARVEPQQKEFTNASGDAIKSEYAIFTRQLVTMFDRIWLPGASPTDATLARVPMKIYEGIDTDGTTTHYEVYV